MATVIQKGLLLKGLCMGDRACTGPFYVTLDLTRRCNLRCFGCRFHARDTGRPSPGDPDVVDLPVEWAEALFSDLAGLGTRQVFLLGDGEPFLHPRACDIVRLAGRHGLRTTVTTNGTLFDADRVREVVASGLGSVHVSLWAGSPESYALQYPGTDPSYFHRVLDGLKALAAAKAEKGVRTPQVVLHNPINRINYRDAEKMADLARESGCDAVSFSPFKTNRGELSRHALSADEQADVRRRLLALKARLQADGMGHNIDRFLARADFERVRPSLPCYVCWYHSRVKVDGTVLSCGRSTQALGSLRTERFAQIWNGAAYRAERRRRLEPSARERLDRIADCEGCNAVWDNLKIHRFLGPLLPLRRRIGRERGRPGEAGGDAS